LEIRDPMLCMVDIVKKYYEVEVQIA
jgi:hypothetical protein